ncbi:hypothetical protein [Streptomyces sp. NPDC058247]|uniref:hypothetical protein n=1 Tax=Streptomyces sp. NPDC058247 TaxID=3346401 RepID=UPI0036EAE7BE
MTSSTTQNCQPRHGCGRLCSSDPFGAITQDQQSQHRVDTGLTTGEITQFTVSYLGDRVAKPGVGRDVFNVQEELLEQQVLVLELVEMEVNPQDLPSVAAAAE